MLPLCGTAGAYSFPLKGASVPRIGPTNWDGVARVSNAPKLHFWYPDFLNTCQKPLIGTRSPAWPERRAHQATPLIQPGFPEGSQRLEAPPRLEVRCSPHRPRSGVGSTGRRPAFASTTVSSTSGCPTYPPRAEDGDLGGVSPGSAASPLQPSARSPPRRA